jgi:hypothetical protein
LIENSDLAVPIKPQNGKCILQQMFYKIDQAIKI